MFDTLGNTFRNIVGKIRFNDDENSLNRALDELKKALLKNDVHHKVTKEIIQQVQSKTKALGIGKQNFLDSLQEAILSILQSSKNYGFVFASKPPTIILMTGLQGSGKTTTSAKLANYLKTKNKKVLLAACDLQRLAAVKQLQSLGEKIEVEVFHVQDAKSPIEVAKRAKEKAMGHQYDVLIIDTAGRLAIDDTLMQELTDIKAAINPDEIFYVADSLSGQDGVRTADLFNQKLDVSGVILSKFDSDSKGGIALSIAYQIGLPLRFIGTGEKIPDFDIFLPDRIVSRLMGAGDIATLAEKTASIIDQKEAKDLTRKIKKGQFTFMDFVAQIENIKKLGSLSSIVSMIPGIGNMASALKNVDLENHSEIKNIKAMVNSMTPKERENPDLLNGSRRRRIAMGCGLEVSDINRIIKQFDNASKIAKRFSNKSGMQDLMSMIGQMQNAKR
ncbi:signal recognition particle protein [Helicobacter mustelae]|uniref:signal-recognition-particle GTPase n=1 Tax=Helicobacter mustelae (strain ATCC 43772 / CCUG 25715 / CIP 103759 / LMG 18044 / NCTC 12198 / R85-136P) TaxID=679897 RepID=D3UGI1_HELM1|nr:signal recognition particle protein [Helicobacter mustelae]CBG39602.1 signal recognition particle protein [Helicobacter mustelae 12198]SQH71114.1 signal recognition particle protein [Helicobacter mustelae]